MENIPQINQRAKFAKIFYLPTVGSLTPPLVLDTPSGAWAVLTKIKTGKPSD